jgi:Tfp pilus assembly protein PilV
MVAVVILLVALTGITAYMAYNAFNTVQAYGARFASVERELGSVKTQAAELKTDTEAVSGRLKRVEDELPRFRR